MKFGQVLYIILFALFLFSCNSEKNYTVKGNISELSSSVLYFVAVSKNETQVDTVIAKNGEFFYKAVSDSIQPVILYMGEGYSWITLWAKNGDKINVSGSAEHPELIEIYGNEINDLLTNFKQENKEAPKDSVIFRAENFIQQHPASIASLVVIQDYLMETEDTTALKIYLSEIESPAKEDLLYTRLTTAISR
ncbi:hypothetical protein AGMMS50262_07000 [Bacteroidia bacterium]|nr:hypothetical protein AGMMS50262_07000 [Bacteroidia bacterium]